jgi:DNA polymerase-1
LKVICDIETESLNPNKIHLIVCLDTETEEIWRFRNVHDPSGDKTAFLAFASKVTSWVGHNFLGFDARALTRLCSLSFGPESIIDTLVLSRLIDSTRDKHSIESYGEEFGIQKQGTDITDWSVLTPEMEARCVSDVQINLRLYRKYKKYLLSPVWQEAIRTEHFIAGLCANDLHDNGFSFDIRGAILLKEQIDQELSILDDALRSAFPPKVHFIKEVHPKATKHGTLNRSDFRWLGPEPDLSVYDVGCPFSRIEYRDFNPASPTQIVERLNEAGWRPTEKTKGHREAEKGLRQLARKRKKTPSDRETIRELEEKLQQYQKTGWSVSEENLSTLPDTAPKAAQSLVRRLLLGSRSSTLNSWIQVYDTNTGRIHGSFNGIGAWTQRMSHDRPNMGNIPAFNERQPEKTPYSDRMRSLWQAGRDRYLVGVDAESIQLRIFAHYLNDEEFTKSLIEGDKKFGTDPHSVNQRALGSVCRSRDAAKTFIYAWLLGAGVQKIGQVLDCTTEEARNAVENFILRYAGLRYLKEKVIPYDAERGYFQGFDGRYVRIWGDDVSSRSHFALAGYLQNGEAVIMKRAVQIWYPRLKSEGVPFWMVNFVHDEWQTETIRDVEVAKYVGNVQAEAIRTVGDNLGLLCPFAGSVFSEHGTDFGDGLKYAIGDNWYCTH